MRAFAPETSPLPLPAHHRFPARKYAMLRARVAEKRLCELCVPADAGDGEILRVHSAAYFSKIIAGALSREEEQAIGLPWSEALVARARRSAGATLAAARAALEDGVAASLAGGTHHAFVGRGEGFCVFNDNAIAARAMQAEGGAHRILILDCDVHQGNGSAAIFAGDESVFTFSIHAQNNFPFAKERSDLDVSLPDGTQDAEYLAALAPTLDEAFARARPDLVLYLSGADPYAGDRLGRLALSKRGLARRDRMVLEACLGRRLPVAVTMGGGYAEPIEDSVDIGFNTLREAAALSSRFCASATSRAA